MKLDRRRFTLAAALFSAAPIFAGCGSGSERSTSGSPPSPPPASPPPPAPPAPAPGPTPPTGSVSFPLRIEPGKRYLLDSAGRPFFIHGDTPWSIEAQLTHAQIDTYLNDRASKGFTALLFQCMEHYFSSQTPPWRNAQSSIDPFTTTTASSCSWTSRVETYWQTMDYIVGGAKSRGMVCFITPAYLGFGGGAGGSSDQGWNGAVVNANAADLQSYGAFLATRYGQGFGNVIWVMGGDYAGTTAERDKQWNIATGIRSVTPSAIITGHGARTQEAFAYWNGYTGFNLNNIYTDGIEYTYAATAYARLGPMPFVLIEGYYDGETATPADCRRQAYASILSGACGHFFGNNPIWGFGEPNANGGAGAAAALSSALNTTATQHMAHVKALFTAYDWWKLQPRTDASLVSSALGSGTSRVCPALASDGSFAMIWKPGSGALNVNLAALTPATVRARFFDTVTGTYSTVTGSPFKNSGSVSFQWPGERVLVLDAA